MAMLRLQLWTAAMNCLHRPHVSTVTAACKESCLTVMYHTVYSALPAYLVHEPHAHPIKKSNKHNHPPTHTQVFDIPFNSANKWALTVSECAGDASQHMVFMKGAPEIILTKCSHHYHNKQERPIDEVRGMVHRCRKLQLLRAMLCMVCNMCTCPDDYLK